jgi:phage portal protein BeeE
MGLLDFFRRKPEPIEQRANGTGYTAELIGLREAWIAGARGLAELTATVQSAVSLWEGGLSSADVTGTDMLDRSTLALIARSLALRGESVMWIRETGLVPAVDWEVSTQDGRPRAYRLSLPDAGGGRTVTVLSAEALHVRIGSDPAAPWSGRSPLSRSSLTASLLHAVEDALAEVYANAALGSMVVPMPETPGVDLQTIGREFRGKRGRVLLRESVNVTAAGGPAPAQDWRPQDTSPDLSKSMTAETLDRARQSIAFAFGILPAMLDPNTTGPLIREGQRQLAVWTLQPIANLIAEEAGRKLSAEVVIDTLRPLQAFDAGLRSRSFAQIIEALAAAKAAGLDPEQVGKALHLVDWKDDVARG